MNIGSIKLKPANAPQLKPVVVVPEPERAALSPFVSVMLPLIPPLTAIEMFDKELPSRLNCGHVMAAATRSVAPFTGLQFTVSEVADATLVNMKMEARAKQYVANRFIGAS